MTTADRIRKEALGPKPRDGRAWLAHSWLGWSLCVEMVRALRALGCYGEDETFMQPFWYMTNTERRMFLLFVAESLEDQ